jgi:glycosyltransferase involved in cell wall biosynthesis
MKVLNTSGRLENTSSPLVSIIMNCFNGEKYLYEAINSIYAQSYNNWELIFWDNISTDDSAVIAKSYDGKLKYFLAKEHVNLGRARNLALKEAKGDYVSFLDCDDVYFPKKIEIQLAAMLRSNAVLSYGGWIKINENGKELKEHNIKQEFGNMFESLLSNYIVNFQTLMIESKHLNNNNISFDENMKFSPDFNLVLRVAYSAPVMAINEILVKYRIHNGSMSNNRKTDKINDFDYTMSFFEKLGVQKEYKNFKYISSKARLRMLLIDAFYDKNYNDFLQVAIQYLFLITRAFLNKSNTSSNF